VERSGLKGLKGDLIEVFKVMKGFDNVDCDLFLYTRLMYMEVGRRPKIYEISVWP